MPRGGRRSGAPGKAYAQRSDLSVNKGPVPNQPYPMGGGQGYGEQKAMMDSQAQMPVSSPQAPGPTAGPPGLPGQPQAPLGPAPGELGTFHGPTERPNEPITHGLPTGPGGGPEVLSNPATRPALTLLQQMAASPFASDDVKALANLFNR